jgi:hypothetical protein
MFHVNPVFDDTVFHGLGHLEVGAQGFGLVAHHDVFDEVLAETFFGTEDGAADDRGED